MKSIMVFGSRLCSIYIMSHRASSVKFFVCLLFNIYLSLCSKPRKSGIAILTRTHLKTDCFKSRLEVSFQIESEHR